MRTSTRKAVAMVLLPLTACTTSASATAQSNGCTFEVGELTVGVHKLWYEAEPLKKTKNKNCVDVSSQNSGHLWIRVKEHGGFTVDLGDIGVGKKNDSDDVQFEVADRPVIEQKKYVVVKVTVSPSVPNNTDFGFDLEVENIGVLDPTVRIIKSSTMMLVGSELKEFADLSFDPELAQEVKSVLDAAFAPDAQSE